jgi:surface protein
VSNVVGTSFAAGFFGMFNGATVFDNGGSDDIDNWIFSTTSNIVMSRMFQNTSVFNRYIGSWNTGRVTNMTSMFQNATAFNQPLSWDTSSVTNMDSMFRLLPSFNQPLNFDTSSVTSMGFMFASSTLFNQPLNWDVSSVTNMGDMFSSATAFNQDISNWNVSNVTNFSNFMLGKTAANYSAANLSSIYDQWSTRPVKPNLSINFGTIDYFAASEPNKLILTSAPNLWTIIDGNPI